MESDDREGKIQALKDYFGKRGDVVMAFVFGSQAKGYARKASDWDIAVYFKPRDGRVEMEADRKEYKDEHRIWGDVEEIVKGEVDFLVLNRAPASIADAAIQEEPLVIKDRSLWLEFIGKRGTAEVLPE